MNLLELKSLNKNICPLWDSKVEWVIETEGSIKIIAVSGNNENAFDNDLLKEEHPSMPISVDRNTRVTFGGTKK